MEGKLQVNTEFPQIGNYKCLGFIQKTNSHTRIKAIQPESNQELLLTLGTAAAYTHELKDIVENSYLSTTSKYQQLTHPNLLPILDAGIYEGMPYNVTPFPGANTLRPWLAKSQDWRDAFRILIPVADVLSMLHGEDLLHRSLTPDNIHIDPIIGLKLANYSLIQPSPQEKVSFSLTGADELVPSYTAPEVWHNIVSPLSDQYSFGVVLYELLTGKLPFISDNIVSLLVLQASKPEKNPSNYIPGLPGIVDAFILKLLAASPTARFEDMAQVKNAMQEMINSPKLSSQPTRNVTTPVVPEINTNQTGYHPTTIEDFNNIHQDVEEQLVKDLKKSEKKAKKKTKNGVSGCGAILLLGLLLLLIAAVVFLIGLTLKGEFFMNLADQLEAWILSNPYLKQFLPQP